MKEDISLGTEIRDVNLIKTEKGFIGDELVAGMLIKKLEDYNHFKQYFQNNWDNNQGCFMSQLNAKVERFKKKEKPNVILGLFLPFFIGCITLVGLIVCFGVVYEWRRRKCIGGSIDVQ